MFLTYLMLTVALSLSAIAAFYSIIGLTAIFAAAVAPIIVMGSILEVAKITVTLWLHEYWQHCRRLMKVYLSGAVFVLMVLTSMGIFGFLSKAHLDQAVPAGDISAQVAVYDEKIKTQRDNIETARNALRQMDAQVDQILGRTTDDRGAERAVQIRRQQAQERTRLQQEISRAQAEIVKLNEQRAPIAAQARKVEAEVGPIKYIAALIYGDNPDQNLLEKAVRWVIILIVIVFDPLAIMMLLAATESMKWQKLSGPIQPETPAGPLEPNPITKTLQNWRDKIKSWRKNDGSNDDDGQSFTKNMDGQPSGTDAVVQPSSEVLGIPAESWGGQDLSKLIKQTDQSVNQPGVPVYLDMPDIVSTAGLDDTSAQDAVKEAKRQWKATNPNDTIHRHEALFEQGKIDRLPWQDLLVAQADDTETFGDVDFGTKFPVNPNKGDAFIRVDFLPSKLFKWNGLKWIEVDKQSTDTFTYNDNYIDYLIAKIGSGEYDPDLLNDNEKQQIEARLRNNQTPSGQA